VSRAGEARAFVVERAPFGRSDGATKRTDEREGANASADGGAPLQSTVMWVGGEDAGMAVGKLCLARQGRVGKVRLVECAWLGRRGPSRA